MKNYTTIKTLSYTGAALLLGSYYSHAALTVYEGFDYTAGTTIVGSGTAADGWDGAWTGTGTNTASAVSPGLTFGSLSTSGGAAQRATRIGNAAISRTIDASAQSSLTADNSTIWFSVLMAGTSAEVDADESIQGFATNSYGTLIFGDTGFSGGSGASAPTLTGGTAFGVGFGDTSDNSGDYNKLQIQGVSYNGGTLTQGGSFTISSETSLIVGSIDWAASGNDDVLSLYALDDPTGIPGTAFATLTGDFDQSTFDTISIGDAQTSVFDEIRIGSTLADVVPVPEPSSTALLGLGGLALILRRRK
ncbi:MAG: PEP-CTERM sorting domain-containing protein [Akkermansiaceae bacterium]